MVSQRNRLVSLAAGTVLDVDPVAAVDVAAAAGYGAVGIWFDPDTFTPMVAKAVRRRLDATGLVALDVEPIILGPEGDPGDALVDAAGEIGARFILLASRWRDHDAAVARTAALCERARPLGVTIAVEFLPPFAVGTLAQAVAFAAAVAAANCGVLVDTLHLDRSRGTVAELAEVPRAVLPYLQLADAPAAWGPDWRDEALHGRLLPGEGDLPLVDVLRVVADVPVSVELRSRALMDGYPDAVERARVVLAATARTLAAAEESG
jgi:sugar phosphate isomerase/epimerase